MNFKPTPEYTWKGLICGVVLYTLFSVVPVIIILRYFLDIDYGSLMVGLIAFLICFVIGRKTYWAYGDRVMMLIFFRSNGKKNNIRNFNHDKDQDIIEVSLDKGDMGILYMLMFFFSLYIAIAVQFLFLEGIELRFPSIDIWKFLGCICLIIILHEALHAFAALLWGKVPWRSIHFGYKWRLGAFYFYCHIDKPLKVNTFRILVLFPLVVTTPIAGLIWWLDPSIWSLLLFSLTIAFCAGDVLMFFKVRQVENDKWIQDHPSEPSFHILPEAISVSSEEHDR